MKRSIAIILTAILVLTMAFSMTACGSEENKGGTADNSTNAPTTATDSTDDGKIGITADDTTFIYNGVEIALDAKIDDVVALLGEADSVKSEQSCHGEGEDRTYTYPDFLLKSYPKDGVDRVLDVIITAEGVATAEGIVIGSSLDDVIEAYGTVYNMVGPRYVYNAGEGKTLRFSIKDNTVTQIEYYFNVPVTK